MMILRVALFGKRTRCRRFVRAERKVRIGGARAKTYAVDIGPQYQESQLRTLSAYNQTSSRRSR